MTAPITRKSCVTWLFLFWCVVSCTLILPSAVQSQPSSPEDCLVQGNAALGQDDYATAVRWYEAGIEAMGAEGDENEFSLVTAVSLETNLATAYSATGEPNHLEAAMEHYESAIAAYELGNSNTNDVDETEARAIVSQTAFFYGMELQEVNVRRSIEMYGKAVQLDPELWAAWANLGSVFQDHLKNYDEALQAYNMAHEILTEHDNPTDPPAEPRFIISQLQYRMGLCLHVDPERRCVSTTTQKEVSCREMATHAFKMAVDLDPSNLYAKHMLATITADATMKKADNEYVKSLFDDYAQNFEHSLVEELGYDGYARLRRGFDRAHLGSNQATPTFGVVLDAGCGTGLVGEQFRNISSHLIGVDLSEAILDEAEKLRPGLYDERIVGDVTEVIRRKQPLSLIVAADSFIYFGDLDPLFDSIEEGLEENIGHIAFTLENVSAEDESTLDETKPDWRWQLTASGRFAHRKEYVASVAEKHNLNLVHYEPLDGFRQEQGKAVRGHLFVLRKGRAIRDEL